MMKLAPTITFHTVTVRVPESRVVRLPGRYRHEFASLPESWREIRVESSKYVDFPSLDPASQRHIDESFAARRAYGDDDEGFDWTDSCSE